MASDYERAVYEAFGPPPAPKAPVAAPAAVDPMAAVQAQFGTATTAPKHDMFAEPVPERPGTIARPVMPDAAPAAAEQATPEQQAQPQAEAQQGAPPAWAAQAIASHVPGVALQTHDQPERRFVPLSGGGYSPAHDVATKSAETMQGYARAHNAEAQAGQNAMERSQAELAHQQAMYEQQAQHHLAQADAMEAAGAKRAQELDALRSDMDDTSRQMAQTKLDPKRAFRDMSTGEKALGIFSVLLGGIGAGLTGQPNRALDQLDKMVNRDVEAQKFAYQAGMDRLGAQKSDFAMAMDKYGQQDAADRMARMSYLDAAATQVEQAKASAKSVDQANHFDDILAQIEEKRAKLHDEATKYVQAARSGPMYLDTRSGAMMTGAQANAQKIAEYNDARKAGIDTTKAIRIEQEKAKGKASADKAKDLTERTFISPDGRALVARTSKEAQDMSEAAASVRRTQAMMQRAMQLRSERMKTINPLEQKRIAERLSSIQSNLITEYGVQKKLGALSDSDMKLALGGVGNVSSWAPGSDAASREYMQSVYNNYNTRIASLPGAPNDSAGAAPSSATKGWSK